MVRAAQLDGWYTTGRKSLLFYLLPWAFLVHHNWMGGTRQGESRYYSIFYLGHSSSITTGWVVHGREKVVTILSFTLGIPRPAQLDGWYTAGRKSLLFYLLPWAFLVQHNWMGGTRQGESPYYSIFYLGRSWSSKTGWVVHGREKVVTILSFTLGVPRPAQLDGWYTAGRKSLLFYLLPWAFLVQHNWMGGTRQGESPYYSIFYLGRSSSITTGWVVHGREKVVTILSFTLGIPRPAQLDGWYTAGRKSLLFYLLPWAFLVQHNWMGGTRQGESPYYSIFYLGRSSSSKTGWVVHAREKVVTILSFTLGVPRPAQLDGWYTAGRKSLLFYLLPWAFLVQHNWMGGTRQGESPYYSIFYLGPSSSSTTGWVVHGREKVLTILSFTLGVPRPAQLVGWYTAGRKSLLFYLFPWAFLVQHNWMGGTRQGESPYYSIFYLGRSSSSTTGWVVHDREKVLTILSFTLGVPRSAQLDG